MNYLPIECPVRCTQYINLPTDSHFSNTPIKAHSKLGFHLRRLYLHRPKPSSDRSISDYPKGYVVILTFKCLPEMILIQQCSDNQMGLNTWAQSRRTISFVRSQTESRRHIYLGLNSDMTHIHGGYEALIGESRDASNPSVLHTPGNVHPNPPNIIRALDEVLSELRRLETKYMFEQHPSNIGGATLNIPFLVRLKFRIKGKRDLKGLLAELERRNEDMKAMTKEMREIARWNLETSA